ncbi:hypothetical protein WAI453_005220 [Rhynchosporium graminicola]
MKATFARHVNASNGHETVPNQTASLLQATKVTVDEVVCPDMVAAMVDSGRAMPVDPTDRFIRRLRRVVYRTA